MKRLGLGVSKVDWKTTFDLVCKGHLAKVFEESGLVPGEGPRGGSRDDARRRCAVRLHTITHFIS